MSRAGSPRRSFGDGAVGLGIVAAMGARESLPVPIVSAAVGVASGFLERSESYTCVVSHEGNGYVRRRVYLGGGGEEVAGGAGGGRVVFFQSPPPPPAMLPVDGFLRNCCLCGKSLRGIDIFMYRGEKAFCSAECRFQQIHSDEHRERCSSEVLKTGEYSVSPCSVPMQFTTGVTAA